MLPSPALRATHRAGQCRAVSSWWSATSRSCPRREAVDGGALALSQRSHFRCLRRLPRNNRCAPSNDALDAPARSESARGRVRNALHKTLATFAPKSSRRNSTFGMLRERATSSSASFASTPMTRAPRTASSAAWSPIPQPKSSTVLPLTAGNASKILGQARQRNCFRYSSARVMPPCGFLTSQQSAALENVPRLCTGAGPVSCPCNTEA